MYYNTVTKTHPSIFHAPGNKSNVARYQTINSMWEQVSRVQVQPVPYLANLKVITWNTTDTESPFERTIRQLGYSCTSLTASPWINDVKIKITIEELQRTSEEMVLAADAFDVVCLSQIHFPCHKKMLISTETCFYPNIPQLNRERACQNNLAPEHSPWKYLNSGGYIGFRDTVLEFLLRCQHALKKKPPNIHSDQFAFHKAFINMQNEVNLDYDCQLFQTITFQSSATLYPKIF